VLADQPASEAWPETWTNGGQGALPCSRWTIRHTIGFVPRTRSRFPIIRKDWPRIVDYRKTMGCFMVDGRRRGNGRREYFTDECAAKTRADQLVVERENHGIAALNFPARDRVMAAECCELMQPFGKTLRQATEHYVAFLKAEAIKSQLPLIRDCIAQFLISRERDVERGELARRTFVETRHFTRHVVSAVGDLRIADFDVEAATTFLDSFPVSARTRLNIRLRLSKFFSFCKSKKWIAGNPCGEIQIKVRRGEVTILSIDDAEHLLRTAETSKFRNTMVPYIVCCLFGGLRPHEAQQLDWPQVNFETATIHVLAHTSKRRESRHERSVPQDGGASLAGLPVPPAGGHPVCRSAGCTCAVLWPGRSQCLRPQQRGVG